MLIWTKSSQRMQGGLIQTPRPFTNYSSVWSRIFSTTGNQNKVQKWKPNWCDYNYYAVLCLVIHSCPTLWDAMDYNTACQTPLSTGILQATILEWVAMPSSRGSSQPRDLTQVSHIAGGFFTIWATREAKEYWNGWPIPSPGNLPDPGIEPGSRSLPADSSPAELPGKHEVHLKFKQAVC